MNYYLGIDCGGTFVKAALFDQTGELHGIHRENVAVISEPAGYAERDMQQLWQVCAEIVRQTIAKSGINPTAIKGGGHFSTG